MKRFVAPVALALFVAVAFGEATTKPVPKPYTTQEVISNPEIEAAVKSIPKAALPKKGESEADYAARRNVLKGWLVANLKGKKIKVKGVVLSETVLGFRIAGMENTMICVADNYRSYKQGDHVAVEGDFRSLLLYFRGDEMWYSFTVTNTKLEKEPK